MSLMSCPDLLHIFKSTYEVMCLVGNFGRRKRERREQDFELKTDFIKRRKKLKHHFLVCELSVFAH